MVSGLVCLVRAVSDMCLKAESEVITTANRNIGKHTKEPMKTHLKGGETWVTKAP